ncbi:hypothetical protein QZC74_001815 [Campylobacter coli]|nr:hypothetical protein [Campylobacter coli]
MINDKTIWTFWEPKDKMPGYVKLCIETWKVFFSDYRVVILDYSNLHNFLPKDFYDESLYENFSLPKQADAIRQRCYIYTVEFGLMLTQLLHLPRLNIFSRILVTFLFFRVT